MDGKASINDAELFLNFVRYARRQGERRGAQKRTGAAEEPALQPRRVFGTHWPGYKQLDGAGASLLHRRIAVEYKVDSEVAERPFDEKM